MIHQAHAPTERRHQTREAYRVTLIGAGIDLAVGIIKFVAGLMVGSAALIADGIHSFSDLVTDGFVLAATHFGRQAPDSDHPYGHGRIETLATLALGSVLIFVAGGIAWASLMRLWSGEPISAPGVWAIAIAVLALAAKEWIFHYTLRVARQVKSRLLEANAWHSRTDALSTVVVLVGLVAAQFGAGWVDAVAAILVGIMVGRVGWRLLWESSRELIDTALPEQDIERMTAIAEAVSGVDSVHELRTRSLGSQVVLDLHIVVAPRLSVSEAHEIGNAVSRGLRQAYPNLADVTFHIDPEDDSDQVEHSLRPGMPLRRDIEGILDEIWHDQPAWQQRVAMDLHYIDELIDVSIYVRQLPTNHTPEDMESLAQTMLAATGELPWIGKVRLWQGPGIGPGPEA